MINLTPMKWIVSPGGTSARELQEVFDSQTPETKAKLAAMSVSERTETCLLLSLAKLFGETKVDKCNDISSTGVSGHMWGDQRAF
jgi:hypothetical protein